MPKDEPATPHEDVTVELTYPVQFGEQVITSLTFRPLKAKDLRRCKAPAQQTMAMSLELAGYLSGQPPHVIDLLEGCDAMEVIGVVGGFFAASHKGGSAQ